MNRSRRAFTLVELLIVVAVMAIIAAIAVPAIIGGADKGKENAISTEVSNCYNEVVKAIHTAGLESEVSRATVLALLNSTYVGASLISTVDISVDADALYTSLVTDTSGGTHPYQLGGITWLPSEVSYDDTHPHSVTLTMSEDGTWQ